MSRLTQTSNLGGVAFTFDLDVTCTQSEMKKILKIAEKLKEYEDAEEQGLLLKLPCPIGTTVYAIYDNKVTKGALIRQSSICFLDDFGKTVFLTKEEAEQKLKEMERDTNGKN